VGIKLLPDRKWLRLSSWRDRVILVAMVLAVVLTFSIDRAMLVGFGGYGLVDAVQRRRPNPYLLLSFFLLVIGVLLQA